MVLLKIEEVNNIATKNIKSGKDFVVSEDGATYETKCATGFDDPENVKRELLLQFKWYGVPMNINELSIIKHGDFTERL